MSMRNAPLRLRVLARRKSKPLEAIAVTLEMSMAGVMLTLLIVMMMCTVALTRNYQGSWLELPQSNHATQLRGAVREDALRIFLTRDGAVYVRNGPIHTEATEIRDLPEKIRERISEGAERRAYVSVDRRTQYADVEHVIDAIRAGGIWNVSFIFGRDDSGGGHR
jgi:biopolymer transport protein ExbD